MAKRLTKWVHVDGRGYAPGTDVPAEVAERITNPHVWDTGDTEPAAPVEQPKPPARSKPARHRG